MKNRVLLVALAMCAFSTSAQDREADALDEVARLLIDQPEPVVLGTKRYGPLRLKLDYDLTLPD